MPSRNILKGALSYLDSSGASRHRVIFQFNPETITRQQIYSRQANNIGESISFTLILNASDGMEQDVPAIRENGIYPQLAALEELLALQIRQRSNWFDWLLPSGKNGFLVLIYGERIIPVQIQQLTMKELLCNAQLKAIHAEVDVALRVLNEKDLRRNPSGLGILRAYQQHRRHSADLNEMIL